MTNALAQPGAALPPTTLRRMQAGFGADFSSVRVHHGPTAQQSAQSIGARAFTLGNHIVFGTGEYRPDSEAGQRLLTHELAHVVQHGFAVPMASARYARPSQVPLRQEASLAVGGLPEETAGPGIDVAINQNPQTPLPSGKGTKAPAAAACPTSIKVADIIPVALTAGEIAAGVRTGWGAVTRMEVSGAGKSNWDGTSVHENLTAGSNDCDKSPACDNGAGQGGNAGSKFTVGDALPAFKHPLLGEIFPAMPKKQNCFYDIHVMGGGVDWCAAKGSCSRTCTQRYDCGGTAFGSELKITYSYSKATMKDTAGKDVSVCKAHFTKA